MGLFIGTTLILTENGCISVEELYTLWSNSLEFYVIVNGKKHKCLNIERCGKNQVVNVLFRNGMEVPVHSEQKFLNTQGQYISLASISTMRNNKNYSVLLNQSDSFVWNNRRGNYDEGYIIALMNHNSNSYTKNGDPMMNLQLRISNDILNHKYYYSYKMITDYFNDNQFSIEIYKHMMCSEWTIYRFKSKYFKTLLCSINCRCVYDIVLFEKCSYDFIQGYLRGVFDIGAQLCMDKDPSKCMIKLIDKRKDYVQSIQRMLLNMGIPSKTTSNKLIIKGKSDIMRYNFIIGFGVEDKSRDSCRNMSSYFKGTIKDSWYRHHYWSYIYDVIECRQQQETYKIVIEGETIAINGILVKS